MDAGIHSYVPEGFLGTFMDKIAWWAAPYMPQPGPACPPISPPILQPVPAPFPPTTSPTGPPLDTGGSIALLKYIRPQVSYPTPVGTPPASARTPRMLTLAIELASTLELSHASASALVRVKHLTELAWLNQSPRPA